MKRKRFLLLALCGILFFSGCGSGGSGGVGWIGGGGDSGGERSYTIGGMVSGFTGTGLVIQNNNADNLAIAPGSSGFTFETKIAEGASYNVSVNTQPTGTNPYQTCAVTNGSGTVAGGDVTNILVNCSTSTWEMLAPLSDTPGFSDFTPAGQSVLYTLNNMSVFAFPTEAEPLGVFSSLTGTSVLSGYIGPAWVGGKLYQVDGKTVYAYDIAGDSWTRPVDGTLDNSHGDARCTADDSGIVYSMAINTTQLLKFNTADSTFEYVTAPGGVSTSEPRVAWDSRTERVYLGGYGTPDLYAFDPAEGSFTALAAFPDPMGMSDAFCSDRRGHIFTVNSSCASDADHTAEVWMYTAETNTWSSFPPLPFAHGCAESCTVSADGWLYYGDGDNYNFARFKIF